MSFSCFFFLLRQQHETTVREDGMGLKEEQLIRMEGERVKQLRALPGMVGECCQAPVEDRDALMDSSFGYPSPEFRFLEQRSERRKEITAM